MGILGFLGILENQVEKDMKILGILCGLALIPLSPEPWTFNPQPMLKVPPGRELGT